MRAEKTSKQKYQVAAKIDVTQSMHTYLSLPNCTAANIWLIYSCSWGAQRIVLPCGGGVGSVGLGAGRKLSLWPGHEIWRGECFYGLGRYIWGFFLNEKNPSSALSLFYFGSSFCLFPRKILNFYTPLIVKNGSVCFSNRCIIISAVKTVMLYDEILKC